MKIFWFIPTHGETRYLGTNHGARHHWLMWLMCLPMVLLVGVLIATGRLGLGGLIYAAGCLLMMGLMMAWMNRRGQT